MMLPLGRTAGAVALLTSQLSPARAVGAVALADYHAPAAALFSNVRVPAALIAGLAVPLGFAVPLPRTKTGISKVMQRINTLLGVFVLSCELSVLSQSTVAIHELTERPFALAASVFDLIKRDLELHWIVTYVFFNLGVVAIMGMVGLRGFLLG